MAGIFPADGRPDTVLVTIPPKFGKPDLQWLAFSLQMVALILFWSQFPLKILKPAKLAMLISMYLLLSLIDGSGLLQHLLAFLILLFMTRLQFRATSQQPLEQARAKVMQLTLVPLFAILGLFALPQILHTHPLINYWLLLVFPSSVFFGLTIAILQYRLHALEYFWFEFWLWISGAALIIISAAFLVWPVGLAHSHAIGLSMLGSGFLYFPLRYWLLKKLLPQESQSLQSFLAFFSTSLAHATTPQAFATELENALQQRFAPQRLLKQDIVLSTAELTDEGVSLSIPGLQPGYSWRLTGKQHASKLFSPLDVKAATAIWNIVQTAYAASESRKQTVLAERERLLQDMHQTVGIQLGKLFATLPQAHHQQAVQDTLNTLNETVRLALPNTSTHLKDLSQEWETEARQRIQLLDTKLRWHTDTAQEIGRITPRQAFELTQFIREAINNALKHASPDYLYVNLSMFDEQLHIQIENNGDIIPIEKWQSGTGTSSMSARIRILNGQWQVIKTQSCLRVSASIPL